MSRPAAVYMIINSKKYLDLKETNALSVDLTPTLPLAAFSILIKSNPTLEFPDTGLKHYVVSTPAVCGFLLNEYSVYGMLPAN